MQIAILPVVVTTIAAISLTIVYGWEFGLLASGKTQFFAWGVSFFFLTRLSLAAFYKAPPEQDYRPSVSVVIAAKDEELGIEQTIRNCLYSGYPQQKSEIIVVDDGSTDATWKILSKLKGNIPGLRIHRFHENQGKRQAMAWGIQQAQGEILVFVDSDTRIAPMAIERIIQPFSDRRVGAVAGHVHANVAGAGLISRMEAVRYFVSHRLFRASESVFACVTCCPGAFSAYRKSAVLGIIDLWLDRRFLGMRTTFGDDRSLTNLVLRDYCVLFHSTANAYTDIPGSWRQYIHQQVRWKKSWFIESPRTLAALFKKNVLAFGLYLALVIFSIVTPLGIAIDLTQVFSSESLYSLQHVLGIMGLGLFFSLFFLVSTRSRHWYFGLFFSLVYLVLLSWLTYYALATVRRSHWGTR